MFSKGDPNRHLGGTVIDLRKHEQSESWSSQTEQVHVFPRDGSIRSSGRFRRSCIRSHTIRTRKRAEHTLRGQVVLITGGTRGLGFAMAQEFARRGARLVICGRDPESLQKAESRLRANGADVIALRCDISSRTEAETLIDRATQQYGRIDVLVNNAGEIAVGPLESQTIDNFERAMNTMFWGMVYAIMAVLPAMRARWEGRIVNITSIGGKVAVPHLLPYACAKFAAVGFSEGLHAESARHGIKVTTVVPGLMRTGSHINAMFKGSHRKEYGWFSLAATLPGSAMGAHRPPGKLSMLRRGAKRKLS